MEYYDKIIQGNPARTVEDIKVHEDVENIFHLGLALGHHSEVNMKSNSRFLEKADISRENIVELILKNHL